MFDGTLAILIIFFVSHRRQLFTDNFIFFENQFVGFILIVTGYAIGIHVALLRCN